MGIYVPNKCWKFRLKFPIRLGENQIFVVVRFLAAPCRVWALDTVHNSRQLLDRLQYVFAFCDPVTLNVYLLTYF